MPLPGPRAVALALATATVLAGCGGDDEPPSSQRSTAVALSNCGQRIEIAEPPKRAVALNQSAAEIMLSLGLADRMAGTAYFSDTVVPSLRRAYESVRVLARTYPSFERVLDAEPDFAYASFAYTFTDEGVAARERFEKLGIPTYISPSECTGEKEEQTRTYGEDDLYGEIVDIARIFGVKDRGERLVAGLRARLRRVRATGAAQNGVSLMWWYSSTTAPYIAGCCGAPGMMTRTIGARNALADNRKLWPEIGWEVILERDPTVLVLADLTRGDDGDSAKVKIDFLERDPVAQKLTAVRRKRYVVLTGSEMDPGIRNVDGVEKLAAGLRRLGVSR